MWSEPLLYLSASFLFLLETSSSLRCHPLSSSSKPHLLPLCRRTHLEIWSNGREDDKEEQH
uniref:Uncharacterized protein n=1 Tax=Nelumbo nucifera TaxID=4432 RepID=A0A822XZ56_NELNU|nr:TPA_asm: hypothetical protein HUJ06_028382 [Nelumbo nucifera]